MLFAEDVAGGDEGVAGGQQARSVVRSYPDGEQNLAAHRMGLAPDARRLVAFQLGQREVHPFQCLAVKRHAAFGIADEAPALRMSAGATASFFLPVYGEKCPAGQ